MTVDSEMNMDTQPEDTEIEPDTEMESVVVVGQRVVEISEARSGGPSITVQGSRAVSESHVV